MRAAVICLFIVLSIEAGAQTRDQAATLTETAYPVPRLAYFVAPSGNDDNEGTVDSPFRTLGHAVDAAPAGAAIVLRHGTYREDTAYVQKRLTIQPFPRERVWLKGSVVVDEWTREGALWSTEWAHRFERDSYEPAAIDADFPYAGYPDMVFMDGRPLDQAGSRDEVGPGSFYADYDAEKLYIGADPRRAVVEVSRHSQALRVQADNVTVRGLGFMHYAGNRFQGAVQLDDSDDATIENNTFAWGASRGLAIYGGRGAAVRSNAFLYNGLMGIGTWRHDDLRLEDNRFVGNNHERFALHGPAAEAAGAKLTVARNPVVRGNVFLGNRATALWLDLSSDNAVIVENEAVDNRGYGIYYEISGAAIIASNLAVRNHAGILVSNSSRVSIYNNTLVDNAESIAILDDGRVNADADERARGITYITDDIRLVNNLLSSRVGNVFLWARDYDSEPLKSADAMIALADANAYHRAGGESPDSVVSWWAGRTELSFSSLDEFRAATGHERKGMLVDDAAVGPLFRDEGTGDYRLRTDSVAVRAGMPLPQDVASAIGVPAHEPVDLGALTLDRRTPAL